MKPRLPFIQIEKGNKTLKELVEADVKLAYGNSVKVSRSKAGALTVREMK